MKFEPKTEEQIDAMFIIPDGTRCFCEVKEAGNHISKEGKESIKLHLAIWEDATIRTYLDVYLTPAFMKLFKHAADAMLTQEKYESGDIGPEDYEGKSCDCIIGIEKAKGNFKEKNYIKDFIKTDRLNDKDLPF